MAERPFKAQDKLTFLLALVPYLIEHDGVSVSEAAAHFGVTESNLRSAVELIAVSGIPGESTQYQHGDLFDIDWEEFEENSRILITHRVAIDDSPRFSAREAAALIAGLQYLSALPENADRTAIADLTAKLARGSSAEPSQVAVASAGADSSLQLIRAAVASGVQVEFDYLNLTNGSTEHRTVDPLRIESNNQVWYLRGWDHLREAVRTFRLDRMTKLARTELPISFSPGDIALPDTLFEGSAEDLHIVVEIAESALPLVADYLSDGARPTPSESRPGWVETTVRVAHYHGLKRLITGLSGYVTVVSPPEARAAVASWASAGAERYS